MAHWGDLAVLAAKLRADGLDVRNLGQVGITVWSADLGYFFPTSELEENSRLVESGDIAGILEKRNGTRPRTAFRLAS